MRAPSADTTAAVRGWLLLVLGVALILYGVIGDEVAAIGWGFSLLGVEPLVRAKTEVLNGR